MWPPQNEEVMNINRRHFLAHGSQGMAGIALASLLAEDGLCLSCENDHTTMGTSNSLPHFAARATNCIFFTMWGGPSQIDLFDPKPMLSKHDGEPIPESIAKDVQFAFVKKGTAKLQGSPYQFHCYDQSGIPVSELLPNLGRCANQITFIRSMHTDSFNHRPGQIFMNTGSTRMGRPGVGSWLNYGLGSPSRELPGFVVLRSGEEVEGGSSNWSSGFLSSGYQGVAMRREGAPILNLDNPSDIDPMAHQWSLDSLSELNKIHQNATGDAEIANRIANYELAFRMQAAAPELCQLSSETATTLEQYGIERPEAEERAFSRNCLLARRLVERGVRFVQIYFGDWDAHVDLDPKYRRLCKIVDQPIAALLNDLKQRGMLDSTLVVWAGEFGRTPVGDNRMQEMNTTGRDHHPDAFTVWMAGGGTKAGNVLGQTDEIGWKPIERPVHVHDFHATLLHLFGLDHTKLTYKHQGRDYRLTDIAGKVIEEILA